MPLTAESPVRSTRRKITGVISRLYAGSIDVCKQGQLVSLHCSTTTGVVVITVALHEFVQKCRGPVDHNRNRLPSCAEVADVPAPGNRGVSAELIDAERPPQLKPGGKIL